MASTWEKSRKAKASAYSLVWNLSENWLLGSIIEEFFSQDWAAEQAQDPMPKSSRDRSFPSRLDDSSTSLDRIGLIDFQESLRQLHPTCRPAREERVLGVRDEIS